MLITQAQVALNRAGNYGLKMDGFFGPKSREALKDFQSRHHLKPDGKLGPLSEEVLERYLDGAPLENNKLKVVSPSRLRFVDTLIVHCTASVEGVKLSVAQVRAMHKAQGWSDIGYHWLILLDGTAAPGRPEELIGAHVAGHNTGSIGVSYVGGLDKNGRPADTRTAQQKVTMRNLLGSLCHKYPIKKIAGHRDFSPDLNHNGSVEPNEWIKVCPCFDAIPEYRDLIQ